jgi:MFS family permease
VISFLSPLEGSIITTALPTITDVIGGAEQHREFVVIASTVVQPVCAQLCNIFGRRNPMIISVSLFVLDSGIEGAQWRYYAHCGSNSGENRLQWDILILCALLLMLLAV